MQDQISCLSFGIFVNDQTQIPIPDNEMTFLNIQVPVVVFYLLQDFVWHD